MVWLIPAAMAAMGAMKADAQNRARKSQNQAEVAKSRYSSWSGLGGGNIDASENSILGGALSGGLAGLGAAQGLGLLGGGADQALSAGQGSMMAGAPTSSYMDAPLGGSSWNFDQMQDPSQFGRQRMMIG